MDRFEIGIANILAHISNQAYFVLKEDRFKFKNLENENNNYRSQGNTG